MAEIKERKYDLLCCITVIDFTEVISSFLTSVEVEKVIWELRFDEKKIRENLCLAHIWEAWQKLLWNIWNSRFFFKEKPG